MSERDGPLSRSSCNGPAIRTFTTTGCAGTRSPTTTCGRSGLDPCTTPADNWAPTTNPYGPTLAEDAQHREDLKAHEAQAASPELPFLGHRPGFPRGVPHTAATGHRPGFPHGVPQTAALTPNCWEKPRGDSPVYLPRTARPRAPCQLCQNSQAHTLSQHGYGALAQLPTRSSSQNGYGASPELVMSPL